MTTIEIIALLAALAQLIAALAALIGELRRPP